MFPSFRTDYIRNLSIVASLVCTFSFVVVTAPTSVAQSTPRRVAGINRFTISGQAFLPNKTLQATNETNVPAIRPLADPTLSINDVTANEGDDGILNSATFTVSLSAPSQQTVTVVVSTQPGTAIGDVDFGAGSITLSIEPGKTSQTITAFVKGDSAVEGTEQFFLNLSNPVNATIADGQGVCTIVDDDSLILLTEANAQRAVALDSVLFTRDSFPIVNNLNFSSDHHTRVSLFAIGLKLLPGENASAVTATTEDSVGTIRPLAVEFVGKVPTYDWLT